MRLYTLLKTYLTTIKPIKYGGTGCISETDIVDTLKTELVDFMYPMGSIYVSISNASPESLFGGSWEQLENRFLLGTGTTYPDIGAIGGSATHTLTIDEMPSHTHTFTGSSSTLASAGAHTHSLKLWYTESSSNKGLERITSVQTRTRSGSVLSAGAHTHTLTALGSNSSTGGGEAHNNMPPYLVVYMWKRIA